MAGNRPGRGFKKLPGGRGFVFPEYGPMASHGDPVRSRFYEFSDPLFGLVVQHFAFWGIFDLAELISYARTSNNITHHKLRNETPLLLACLPAPDIFCWAQMANIFYIKYGLLLMHYLCYISTYNQDPGARSTEASTCLL